jgi:hypothetical protein
MIFFYLVAQSLVMADFYAGEGTDHSGVPTKLVTVNSSLHIAVYNPATMFGIHVTSGPIHMMYSDISIGVGQVCAYRSSFLFITTFKCVDILSGNNVPLLTKNANCMVTGFLSFTLSVSLHH